MPEGTLAGQSVLVAGAGLAGLAAAHDLIALGADVTVVDSRDRVGGRVWTIHDGFAERQHAEAGAMYRIEGGNDQLARALAQPLGDRLHLSTDVVAVAHRGKVARVTLKNGRTQSQINCDYVIFALPATTLRRIPIMPSLPAPQHDAIANLKYGRATKTLMQFPKR